MLQVQEKMDNTVSSLALSLISLKILVNIVRSVALFTACIGIGYLNLIELTMGPNFAGS